MKRFKARKRINRRIIYIGLFLISVAFSIRYLYRNDLVQKDTLIDVLISDSLGSYKSNIFDIDFLFKYALNIDLDKDTPVVKDDEDSHPLEVQPNPELEPIVYIYNMF